jgi:2-amino-4-hydroxy-6-hydroxymethyldihydropteridine diphosphokinase
MATVYIGLGSNLGNREAHLQQAMRLFKPELRIMKCSPMYETDMLYRIGRPRYYNIVCRVETELPPEQVFEKCKAIEKAMGTRPVGDPFGPCPIDVEVLFYDDVVLRTEVFTLPHPRLHERAFVLVPLDHIATRVVHPVLKKTIGKLLAELGDYSHKIIKIEDSIG